MTVRFKKTIKLITLVLLASLLLLGMAPAKALGGTGYKIEGESNGLIIASPLAPEDTGNLGPGDQKHSRLKLTNTNTSPVTVYIRTVIVEEDTPPGGADLADGMFLTIKDGDKEIFSGTFGDAHVEGNISLGSMEHQDEKIMDFYADFPEDSELPEEPPVGALPGMPKTGEGLPYPYYLAGACAIVAGIGLLRNKSKS